MQNIVPSSPPVTWLLRVPEVFSEFQNAILDTLEARFVRKLGREFLLVKMADPGIIHDSRVGKYVRWNVPIHHAWPCHPKETQGFIEKAAQALYRKFGEAAPQAVIVGAVDASESNRYYRTLASNLRGRVLQLFPQDGVSLRDAEAQDGGRETLFCLVGKEGLFCGMQSPAAAKGFYPGGTKFIRQSGAESISRAGAKVAEALHHLRLIQPPPPAGSHWLELGASPGGMTSELLARGYRVTAVDRAPLDARLAGVVGLKSVLEDAAEFVPGHGALYDAILCDMNGSGAAAMRIVSRLVANLREGGLVIFTLKTAGAASMEEIDALEDAVMASARAAGLQIFDQRHLSYNRHEFTLFFRKNSSSRLM